MKVLIGTNNAGKIKKYSEILEELNIEYCTLKDLNINIDIKETGNTVEENSLIKAKTYYKATKMPVIADDSGLKLDNFPEEMQPGIYVRRHNGKELTDEEIIELYSKEIEKIGGETTGTFNIAITVVDNKGKEYTKVTKHDRLFVSKPCEERIKGYPMNSLIYDKEKKKYLAQNYNKDTILNKNRSVQEEMKFIGNVLKQK